MTLSSNQPINQTDPMHAPFKGIYSGKKVLITGHTGFKGSWLSIWLKELEAEVIGYSLEPPSKPNNFTACDLENKITHIHGDIRDMDHLVEVFRKYEPEFIFHLAAQPLVRLSYQEPKLTFDTNVGGTVNVLEAVRQAKTVRVVVNVTSDKCYENKEWVWGYREDDPMGGYDPYSSSKGCAEMVTSAYRRSFFNPDRYDEHRVSLSSVRTGNVIGGGDWGEDRLIPDCVRALAQDRAVLIRNLSAIRPWQHVLEPLSGYLWLGDLLLENPEKYSGAWNFGPRDEATRPVQEIVEAFIKLWGSGSWTDVSTIEANPIHEATLLKLCCDKAHTYLGWRTCLILQEALQYTVQWYKDYYQGNPPPDMYNKCVAQIQEYNLVAQRQDLVWAKGQE